MKKYGTKKAKKVLDLDFSQHIVETRDEFKYKFRSKHSHVFLK